MKSTPKAKDEKRRLPPIIPIKKVVFLFLDFFQTIELIKNSVSENILRVILWSDISKENSTNKTDQYFYWSVFYFKH